MLATAFLIAALVVFILAAIPVPVPRINLVALGLALFTAAFLVGKF
jgi:hypothetical protein